MKCFKEKTDNKTILCECGSEYFVYGENFNIVEREIICNCGCLDFEEKNSIIKATEMTTEYICKSCENKITLKKMRGKDFEIEKFVIDLNK
jgi:hypothetical protein